MNVIDAYLNRITMYRLVLYALIIQLLAALAYMLSGVLSYSAAGLLITALIVIGVCLTVNWLLARLMKLASNRESSLLTALILICILPQTDSVSRAAAVALAAAVAMAIKYVLTIRGSHFLNPAAAGALVAGLTLGLPITWWIGSPPMLPISLLLGIMVLRKVRRLQMFGVFSLSAVLVISLVAIANGQATGPAIQTLLFSYPLIFLGTIMLTEPTTLPVGRLNGALYAVIVGALFSAQLHAGPLATTPHLALLAGNLFVAAVTPQRSVRLRFKSMKQIGADQYDFAFETIGRRLRFTAGQYAEWTLPGVERDSRGNRRTFTVASAPEEPLVHLGIRSGQPSSAFKQRLLSLKDGDTIQAGHIAGEFTLPNNRKQKILMIAGGVGITPYRSMLGGQAVQARDIVLLYAGRADDEFLYQKELSAARTLFLTKRTTAAVVKEAVPDYRQRLVYLSGSEKFVAAVYEELLKAGIQSINIRRDYFSGY